jgi:uncharacterized damage-inducible protein DinB
VQHWRATPPSVRYAGCSAKKEVNVKVQDSIRTQLDFWHNTFDQMVADCGDALHAAVPGSKTNSIAATYAHAVISEDVILRVFLQSGKALSQADEWQEEIGVAFPGVPPMMTPEWAAALNLDLSTFQPYAKAVYAAPDAYLANLQDDELERKTQGPFGETTVGWMISMLLATHPTGHAGEVAALKGVHGQKGLPF